MKIQRTGCYHEHQRARAIFFVAQIHLKSRSCSACALKYMLSMIIALDYRDNPMHACILGAMHALRELHLCEARQGSQDRCTAVVMVFAAAPPPPPPLSPASACPAFLSLRNVFKSCGCTHMAMDPVFVRAAPVSGSQLKPGAQMAAEVVMSAPMSRMTISAMEVVLMWWASAGKTSECRSRYSISASGFTFNRQVTTLHAK